jgi:hypothetical protein
LSSAPVVAKPSPEGEAPAAIGALSGPELGAREVPLWEGVNGGVMARFSERMVTEVVQRFWAAMARGEFITDAAVEAGTYLARRRLDGWPRKAVCARAAAGI